jgi:hypothetical protein
MSGKLDLLEKYSRGLTGIWKTLIDDSSGEMGDPLELFHPALVLTEKSLQKILED